MIKLVCVNAFSIRRIGPGNWKLKIFGGNRAGGPANLALPAAEVCLQFKFRFYRHGVLILVSTEGITRPLCTAGIRGRRRYDP
jgi:hypothetical protein